MTDTDTKRLRELYAQLYDDETFSHQHEAELRSLILSACDELERLRDACVSTGWLDAETPLSLSNHVVQMYGEACVAQDNAATLRAENEKLRAALVQANETAELLYCAVDRQLLGVGDKAEYETMRGNMKEILG